MNTSCFITCALGTSSSYSFPTGLNSPLVFGKSVRFAPNFFFSKTAICTFRWTLCNMICREPVLVTSTKASIRPTPCGFLYFPHPLLWKNFRYPPWMALTGSNFVCNRSRRRRRKSARGNFLIPCVLFSPVV